jgi:photosystem II stability/assembly factor-like uncharacterized protein
MRFFILCLVLFFSVEVEAQPFLKSSGSGPLRFREMQLRFSDWARTRDLGKEKYWKYYKRWESDMQRHLTPSGEPADASLYIGEAVKAAAEKEKGALSRVQSLAWYPAGPDAVPDNHTGYMENGIGRINCIAFHPSSPSTYFAGVAQGGIWKTTNNGQTWTPLTDNLPITRISDIAIDPNNPNTMYASICDFEYIGFGLYLNGKKRNTHYGLGVYKTTDGGLTWQPTGLSFQLTDGDASLIRKVLVNPSNSNKLAACGVSGMYTSGDGGATWTKNLDSLFWDMVQDPLNPDVLYAATGWVETSNTGSAAIYKSVNFGLTWTRLNTGIPPRGAVQRIKLAVAPSDNNYVYGLAVDVNEGLYGFYKSTDAGGTWQFINPGLNVLEYDEGFNQGGQGTYDLALCVDRQNKDLVYTGGINIWASGDGCQTFNPVSHWTLSFGPTLHGDIHFIEQHPLTGNFFVCNDGGLYRTAGISAGSWNDAHNGVPWPTQWTNISNGMAITSFYRLSSSRSMDGRLVAGAQDNATFYYDGTSWSTIFGGDGMDNYLDQLDDQYIVGSSQFGNFLASYDGGLSYSQLFPNVNGEPAEWTTPLVADYNRHGTLYAGFANVCRSDDNGLSWSVISSFPSGFATNEISALAVSETNSDVLYAARRVRYEYGLNGNVYKTSNGGASWADITAGLPDSLFFTGIEVSGNDPNTAYITLAGFSAGQKVYRTSDGGLSWQNISYNLPNIPVNCVRHLPGTPGDVLIGTDLGVYQLQNGSTTWVSKSQGLPNVIVSDIEINPALNRIYISTFGRGIWAADLSPVVVSASSPAAQHTGFELFPTAGPGDFTLRFEKPLAEQVQLDLIDVTGKTAFSAQLSGNEIYHHPAGLAPGVYFARVKGKSIQGVQRFIVR